MTRQELPSKAVAFLAWSDGKARPEQLHFLIPLLYEAFDAGAASTEITQPDRHPSGIGGVLLVILLVWLLSGHRF